MEQSYLIMPRTFLISTSGSSQYRCEEQQSVICLIPLDEEQSYHLPNTSN